MKIDTIRIKNFRCYTEANNNQWGAYSTDSGRLIHGKPAT